MRDIIRAIDQIQTETQLSKKAFTQDPKLQVTALSGEKLEEIRANFPSAILQFRIEGHSGKRFYCLSFAIDLDKEVDIVFQIRNALVILLLSIEAVGQELPQSMWDPDMRAIQGRIINALDGQPAADVDVYLATVNVGCVTPIKSTKTDRLGNFKFDRLGYYTYVISTDPEFRLNLDATIEKSRAVIRMSSRDITGIELQIQPQQNDIKVSECGMADSTQSLMRCFGGSLRKHDAQVSEHFGRAVEAITNAAAATLNSLRDSQRMWEKHRKEDCKINGNLPLNDSEKAELAYMHLYACQIRLDVVREAEIDHISSRRQ